MEPMVNETFVARNPDVRWTLPLAILGLFILRGMATFVTDYGMARAGRSVVRDLRTGLLGKYLRLPSERFDREPVAMLVSRRSSVGGMAAAAVTPVASAYFFKVDLTLMFLAFALVVLWRHRANIERLIDGTEPRIGQRGEA